MTEASHIKPIQMYNITDKCVVLQIYAALFLSSLRLSEIQAGRWDPQGRLTKGQDPTAAKWLDQG